MQEQLELEFDDGAAAGGNTPPASDLLDALGDKQVPFDFSAADHVKGFQAWRDERNARLARIARFWQLPLGKRVRVQLIARSEEPEGLLMLREEPESFSNRRAPLALRVGGVSFSSHEIQSLVRMD